VAEIKDFINLSDFLSNSSKNYVLIHFNQEFFEDLNSKANFIDFKGKWIFIEHHSNKDKILYSQKFYLKEIEFPIFDFYNSLNETESKWSKICPLIPFPDIVIVPNDYIQKYSAFVSYDNLNYRHVVFLTLDELQDINRFKFVLGHELGHIYYNVVKKREVDLILNSKKYSHFSPWWIYSLLILCILFYLKIIFTESEFTIKILATIQTFIWVGFLSIHMLGFERFKNYSAEFFSDYFSFCFMGKCTPENMGLHDSKFNLFTHPSSFLRFKQLKDFNENNELEDWKNPVEIKPIYYTYRKIYEMFIFIENKLKTWKPKLYGFFKKKKV
jgi:hypothetical protein